MTTTSPTRLASSTSVRCPSWSAPIVGTNAMPCPLARASATTPRISDIVSTNFILEAVFSVRICAASNVARPVSNCGAHLARHLGVTLQELRVERIVEPEHIGQDEDLTVALGASADSNRWNADCFRHACGNRSRNQLENDCECTRVIESFR